VEGGALAAIDPDVRARHEARFVARDKGDRCGDFLGATHPADGVRPPLCDQPPLDHLGIGFVPTISLRHAL